MLDFNMLDICKLTLSTLLGLTTYWLKVDCCEVETLNGRLSSGVYFENQLDNSEQCQRLCWYSKSCRSCSWGKRTGLCQLSKDTKDISPDAFSVSQHHIYTETRSPPCLEVNHPCTDRPCSLTEICVPTEKVTSYVCLHMVATASPTSTTTGISYTVAMQQTMTMTTVSPTTTGDSCIADCVERDDGDYQCCDTCVMRCACTGEVMERMDCDANLVWDNQKGRCEHTSDTCTINS